MIRGLTSIASKNVKSINSTLPNVFLFYFHAHTLIAAEGSILIFTVFLWYPVLLAELYRVDVISIFALIQGGGGGLSFWKYSPNGTSHMRLNV